MAKSDKISGLADDVLFDIREGLLDNDVGQALLSNYRAGVCDSVTAGMLRSMAQRERTRRAFSGTPFRRPKLRRGEVVVGFDTAGDDILMPLQYLNAHCLTVSNTGGGKTTKSRFNVLQIASKVRGMWLLDLRKREFRLLPKYLHRLGIDLLVLPAREMRVNPLQVPLEVDPADWATRAADTLIQVLGLPPRASKLTQIVLHRLYRRFRIFEGAEEFPTLYDLFEEIKTDRQANPQSRLAILDSLSPVLSSLGPEVLAYRRGWSTHDLASMHISLEFAGLAETDKNLLLNFLCLSEFASRVARGISNPKMDLWICCDEASRLCSASGSTAGANAISDLIGLVRGTGIGLDLSVLSTSDLAPQVISNCATKIMGRCGSAADYTAAGRSMGLSAEQIQWAQLHLEPGVFIGQLGEGHWRQPFIFRIPKMRLPASASSGRKAIDIGALASLRTVPAEEFKDWGKTAPEISSASLTPKPAGGFASEQEYRFCKAVADHPMQPSSGYAKLAGISSRAAVAIRRRLVAAGHIREHEVQTKARGRSSILLEVLPAGEAAVRAHESGRVGHDN